MNHATMTILALVSLLMAILALAGCTSPGITPEQRSPSPSPTVENEAYVVLANNQFALDLYKNLAGDQANSRENLFFSPFSISSAMAIACEGARGDTAREIREVFFFPENTAVMRGGYEELISGINSGSSAYSLNAANALFAEQTYPFRPDYIAVASQSYGAKATNLDFINNPDNSRLTINRWIEEQTNDKIKDLIPPGSITPLTRLVITNAVYFKGNWQKQFDENETTMEDFQNGDGTAIRVPIMQRTDKSATYGYTETADLQVLRMPYESDTGKSLTMLVLLPRDDALSTIEQSLTIDTLTGLQQNLTEKRVMVYFPRFTMETKYFLPRTLSAMGMPTAFTTNADFSGMDGTRDLLVTDVIHQAFIDVNEEGTEAAAATAVIIGGRGYTPVEEPVPVFRADHPFIFFIQDDETGLILFMGRVMSPTAT